MSQGSLRQVGRTFDVLLVEPDPDGVAPLIESLESTEFTGDVHVISDGETALDFLHQRGDHAGASRPDLILLALPITTGVEVLVKIKDHPDVQCIPVIVLTASDTPDDILRSYKYHANACVEKPSGSTDLAQLAEIIESFWLKRARLPPK